MESASTPSTASAAAAATAADPPASDAVNGCSGLGDGDDGACEQGKLFVGGIPWDATEEALRDYFGKYGQVVEVIIMKDRVTGNPRGFGFVSFVDPSSADMAIQDTSVKHSILGRLVDVKRAKPRGSQQQSRQHQYGDDLQPENSGSSHSTNATDGVQFSTKKIFVGGLSANLTKEDFKSYFERFGTITDVVVMNDNVTHRPRGFGFVTFDSEESVENAVQQTFQTLSGKTVEVKRAVPKEGGGGSSGKNHPNKNRSNGGGYGSMVGNERGPYYHSYPVGMYPRPALELGFFPAMAQPFTLPTTMARTLWPWIFLWRIWVQLWPTLRRSEEPLGRPWVHGRQKKSSASTWSPGHYPYHLNGDVSPLFDMRTGGGSSVPVAGGELNQSDIDSQVQYVSSQLGASTLDDRQASDC
ncbi:unnamed protein product [Spirodela intermedia]|uniref:RRM domain-containing protein n=1 Tax=Spirodela intermedia TaxID=51605 RepID=A0A7I8IIK1_SPIIN|nr:unnamed protein product [Spirodela intermedia]CAA6657682.1 unnamed protein product [Spirodela intermedia]